MTDRAFSTPSELTDSFAELGHIKAARPLYKQILLGVIAGAFVALATQGANVLAYGITDNISLARALSGAMFASALIMVIIAGAELFTGNTLMVISVIKKRITLLAMLRSWGLVYFGNFLGAMFIVLMIVNSSQFDLTGGTLGGYTIRVAVSKTGLTFSSALIFGILCNWLVCLGVWMAYSAQDITGKIVAIFFPIWLFVASGFEHSIANMYTIPAGILASRNPYWVQAAIDLGVSAEGLANLSWQSFLLNNLLPVTLGNIIGGAVFVGITYLVAYGKLDPRHRVKKKLTSNR